MLTLRSTTRFMKDMKRAEKRGRDIDRLEEIVNRLQQQTPLQLRYKDHKLSGDWEDFRECHIEPDWLLIYQITESDLILVRTGSHADLFG